MKTARPWFRLADSFVRRIVKRLRVRHGIDERALVHQGLVSQFVFENGKLIAWPSFPAAMAARHLPLLKKFSADTEAALRRPRSEQAREFVKGQLEAGPDPAAAAALIHLGNRPGARKLLKLADDESAVELADAARVMFHCLGDRRGARGMLERARRQLHGTADAAATAEAFHSVLDDRDAASRILEDARRFVKTRSSLYRLAWSWGALLGDDDRARALLREAQTLGEAAEAQSLACHWRALFDDEAEARASIEKRTSVAANSLDWACLSDEWRHIFGDRKQALAAARNCARAATGASDRLKATEALVSCGDRAGARSQLKAASEGAGQGEWVEIAIARKKLLRDRAGSRAAFASAIAAEPAASMVQHVVEQAGQALGRRDALALLKPYADLPATSDEHAGYACLHLQTFHDQRRHDHHVARALELAASATDIASVAAHLRYTANDPDRAEQLVQEAMRKASTLSDWMLLASFASTRESDFKRDWARVEAMAATDDFFMLFDHAKSSGADSLVRLPLEALERRTDTGPAHWLLAAREWHGLGEPARVETAMRRAVDGGAGPLETAETWAVMGDGARAASLLTIVENGSASVTDLCRCAATWHTAGQADKGRATLEKATAQAAQPEEHQICAAMWKDLFNDLVKAEACSAKASDAPPMINTFLPIAATLDVREVDMLPRMVGI